MNTTLPGPDGRPRCRWCASAPEFLPYHDKIAEYDEAKKAINGLKNLHAQIAGAIEDELADLAVRFQIPVYIGDYGNGRSVQLVEDAYGECAVGEWVSSSSRC